MFSLRSGPLDFVHPVLASRFFWGGDNKKLASFTTYRPE